MNAIVDAGTGSGAPRAGRREWIGLAVLALLDAAHAAFTIGLNTVAGLGAGVFVALPILAALALRRSGETSAALVAPAAA